MTVPSTYSGTHEDCGGAVVFRPVTRRRELLAGETVTLTATCRACGELLRAPYALPAVHAELAGEQSQVATTVAVAGGAHAHEAEVASTVAHAQSHAGEAAWSQDLPVAVGDGRTPGSAAAPSHVAPLRAADEPADDAPAEPTTTVTPAVTELSEWRSTREEARPAAVRPGNDEYLASFREKCELARANARRMLEELPSVLTTEGFRTPQLSPSTNLSPTGTDDDAAAHAPSEPVVPEGPAVAPLEPTPFTALVDAAFEPAPAADPVAFDPAAEVDAPAAPAAPEATTEPVAEPAAVPAADAPTVAPTTPMFPPIGALPPAAPLASAIALSDPAPVAAPAAAAPLAPAAPVAPVAATAPPAPVAAAMPPAAPVMAPIAVAAVAPPTVHAMWSGPESAPVVASPVPLQQPPAGLLPPAAPVAAAIPLAAPAPAVEALPQSVAAPATGQIAFPTGVPGVAMDAPLAPAVVAPTGVAVDALAPGGAPQGAAATQATASVDATTTFPTMAPDKAVSAQMAAAVLAAAEQPTLAVPGGPPAAPVLAALPVHVAGTATLAPLAPPPQVGAGGPLVSAAGFGGGIEHGGALQPHSGDFDWGLTGDDEVAAGRKRNVLLLLGTVVGVVAILWFGYTAGSKLLHGPAASPTTTSTKVPKAGTAGTARGAGTATGTGNAAGATTPHAGTTEGEASDLPPTAGTPPTAPKAAAQVPASPTAGASGNKALNSTAATADGSTGAGSDPMSSPDA